MHRKHLVCGDEGIFFETVGVLGKQEMEQAFPREQTEECVGSGRFEAAGMASLCDGVERLRSMGEIADMENCLGKGQLEGCQFLVETTGGGAEVGDSGGGGDARACQDDDSFRLGKVLGGYLDFRRSTGHLVIWMLSKRIWSR